MGYLIKEIYMNEQTKRQLAHNARELSYKRIAEFAGINQTMMRWVTSFASTAIEGNKASIRMMGLWETDKEQFVKEVLEYWEVKQREGK